MKLIEKKCPNCGAGLSFKPTDKQVKCEYCKQEYGIENENHEEILEGSLDEVANNFTLHKKTVTTIATVQIIMSAIVIILILCGSFLIFNEAKKQMNKTPDIVIEKIDSDAINTIHETSISELKRTTMYQPTYRAKDYEPVKYYLYKDAFGDVLTDVFKTTYTNSMNNNEVDVYIAVTYNNVKYSNNKITYTSNTISINTISLDDSGFGMIIGYKSLEDLYNSEIVPKAKGEIIESK